MGAINTLAAACGLVALGVATGANRANAPDPNAIARALEPKATAPALADDATPIAAGLSIAEHATQMITEFRFAAQSARELAEREGLAIGEHVCGISQLPTPPCSASCRAYSWPSANNSRSRSSK